MVTWKSLRRSEFLAYISSWKRQRFYILFIYTALDWRVGFTFFSLARIKQPILQNEKYQREKFVLSIKSNVRKISIFLVLQLHLKTPVFNFLSAFAQNFERFFYFIYDRCWPPTDFFKEANLCTNCLLILLEVASCVCDAFKCLLHGWCISTLCLCIWAIKRLMLDVLLGQNYQRNKMAGLFIV